MNRNMSEYALPFAAWELRLYLDTHPDDERALNAYKQLCAAQGSCTYACHTPEGRNKVSKTVSDTAPRTACQNGMEARMNVPPKHEKPCDDRWTWIDSPWPWEYEANVVGGKC